MVDTLIYSAAVKVTAASSRDGADAVRLDTPATGNSLISTRSAQTAYVQAILSASGATVDVAVILYSASQEVLGVAAPGVQTATATSYTADNDAADYYAPILAFDLAGADYYEVRSGDASSGTRTLYTWTA